ncbi:MAG TPA: DUF1499 domain-containing protein [Longimicrobium sp.]|jgi:uncharacterized protein (DUF1499 family)
MGIWTALTRNVAQTRPGAPDPRLRGRAYAAPFAQVWDAALAAARAMPRWTVAEPDARSGTIRAEAHTGLLKFTDDVSIRISLDDKGMTRVDVRSASRVGSADFGTNARRVARFLHAVDARLAPGASAEQNR